MEDERLFFDKDLATIMRDRLKSRTIKIIESLFGKSSGKPSQNYLRHRVIESVMDNFIKDEIDRRFPREVENYKKAKRNHKREYQSDIEKARAGEEKSLFFIIGWDKAWLFIPWVKQRILRAQEDGDLDFIKALGESVAKESGVKTVINAADKEERRKMLDYATAELARCNNRNRAMVIDRLYDMTNIDELADKKDFKRYLRRHNVI